MARRRKTEIKTIPFGVSARIDVAPDDPTQDTVTETVQKFIAQALRRWKLANDAEDYNRREGFSDVKMIDGEGMWDSTIAATRQLEKRPCLVINRFIPMLDYINNEQRQMHLGIQVHPIGDGADVEGAQVRQGLIRAIENDSHADIVYDTAFEAMLEKGWAWFRVVSEWENETSHNQVLRIKGFANDFCVYADPNAQEPSRRDMDWAFVTEDIPRGEYKSLYPTSRAASLSEFQSTGDQGANWFKPDYVRVAEYYYADYVRGISVKLVDGTGRWKDELREENGIYFDKRTGEPVPVDFDEDGQLIERESRKRTIKWAKINAVEILEGNKDKTEGRDLMAKWIPLIMVAGRERTIDGQRRLAGKIRHNREVQRVYNYLTSAFVEAVALMPKAPYVVAAGQIEQYKPIWDALNDKNWPYLPYDPMTKDMQAVPPPQRQNIEPPVQAIGLGIQQFDNMIKAGFNVFDSAVGKLGPQQSGKAALVGKTQSESANMHWIDNLGRSIQHCGEVILDLIPTRYDAPRVVSIVRPNEERTEQAINQIFTNKKGEEHIYDMARGTYSCVVTAGLTSITRRQESLQSMFALMEGSPQLPAIILDLVVEQMDWPGSQKIAERLKKALPPGLRDEDQGAQIPPEVQMQLQQLMQQYQGLQEEFQHAQQIIQGKQTEAASREKIAQLQARTTMAVAAAKFSSAEQMKRLELEFKRVAELLKDSRERAG